MTEPTRRQKLQPIEYVALSGVMALFAGLVILMVTRDLFGAIIASGLVFIVVIIGIAMLLLAVSPNSTPDGQKSSPGTGND